MTEILACLIGLMFILMVADVSGGKAGADTGAPDKDPQKATFAGGCFWCMEPPFDKLEGVISTTVGYTGGKEKSPTYEQVCSGQTGHAEAIEVVYDPKRISYSDLLEVFCGAILIPPSSTGSLSTGEVNTVRRFSITPRSSGIFPRCPKKNFKNRAVLLEQ